MKKRDRLRLTVTRNWNFPGKARLARWLKPGKGGQPPLRDGISWLVNEDIAIFNTGHSFIEWTILTEGTYEDEINKMIRLSLNAGDTALDVGANIGLQSLRMAQRVGGAGRVLAFEPLEHLQKKFRRNMELNRAECVTLLNFALSDQDGNLSLPVDENAWNQGAFSLGNNGGGASSQQVFIKKGDDVGEVAALTHLELIKIDVEGFEFQVIRGLAGTIRKFRPRLIFEYEFDYWQASGQRVADCYDFLGELGYSFWQITAVGAEKISDPSRIENGNVFCAVVTL